MAAVAVDGVALRGRGPRVGVALSPLALCAAIQKRGDSRVEAWRVSLTPLNGDGSWSGLTEALRTLARDSGVTDGRLTVALLPPLAEARGVELPPVSDDEAQQLLVRGATKYFVGARGPQVVGSVKGARRGEDGETFTVAATASSRLLKTINDSANAAGWTLEGVIPAEAAWGLAASKWTARKNGRAQLLIAHNDRTDLLRIDRSRLVGLRRFRAGAADAALIAEASSNGAGPLAIVGSPDVRRELTRQLTASGVTVETPASAVVEVAEHPDLLAAAFAGPDASPRLLTDAARAKVAIGRRNVAIRVAIAAGVLVLLGLGSELWGAKRELASIRAQEAGLKDQLSLTLVGTTSVATMYNQLSFLATADKTAPRWSSVIAAVSEHLPTEASLIGFRGAGDSLRVDGAALNAGRALDALSAMPQLAGAKMTTMRRVLPPEGPPKEQFTINASVVPRGGARGTPKPAAALPPRSGR